MLVLAAPPASAAVTKSAGVDENPRLGWLERFQESRQGQRANRALRGDVQGRRRRGARLDSHRRRRARHHRPHQRNSYRSHQARAAPRFRGGQAAARPAAHRSHPGRRAARGSDDLPAHVRDRSLSANVDYTITVPVIRGGVGQDRVGRCGGQRRARRSSRRNRQRRCGRCGDAESGARQGCFWRRPRARHRRRDQPVPLDGQRHGHRYRR